MECTIMSLLQVLVSERNDMGVTSVTNSLPDHVLKNLTAWSRR